MIFFLGCAVTWMTIIIQRIVFELQWISALALKSRWKRFKFRGHDVKNRAYFKFDMVKKEVKICNKVAHVKHLILLFAIVLYSKVVDPANPVWKFYLKVAHLTRLLLTRNHNESSLTKLQTYIRATLNARMDLTRTPTGEYEPKIKSKEHNLNHYPFAIRWAGPLSLQSSSLCEQYHQFCKRAFGSSRCTKNLLKTMLRRIDGKLLSRSQATIQVQKVTRLRSEDELDQEALAFYRQYPLLSRLRSSETTVGKISVNDVVGCPGSPDGRFFKIGGLVQSDMGIKILGQPLSVQPLLQMGLFELNKENVPSQIFDFDCASMIPVNSYVVDRKHVFSLNNYNLNLLA